MAKHAKAWTQNVRKSQGGRRGLGVGLALGVGSPPRVLAQEATMRTQ